MRQLHFCLVGGDARQQHLARLLRQDGHTVTTFALGEDSDAISPAALSQGDCVLLPIPTAKNGLLTAPFSRESFPIRNILDELSETQLIFGGNVAQEWETLSGLTIHDLLRREELTIANAVPTAEGALQLAMEQLPVTIHRSRVLITGYGRVAQCTAQRFAALGAWVTVTARNPAQLAAAEAAGLTALPLSELPQGNSPWDLVINTVPAPILTKSVLEKFGGAPILELASPPGGVDLPAARALGISVLSAPGLPGKAAPATAADIIRRTVYGILAEAGF